MWKINKKTKLAELECWYTNINFKQKISLPTGLRI